MNKTLIIVVTLFVLATTACGRKGNLAPPPGMDPSGAAATTMFTD